MYIYTGTTIGRHGGKGPPLRRGSEDGQGYTGRVCEGQPRYVCSFMCLYFTREYLPYSIFYVASDFYIYSTVVMFIYTIIHALIFCRF